MLLFFNIIFAVGENFRFFVRVVIKYETTGMRWQKYEYPSRFRRSKSQMW